MRSALCFLHISTICSSICHAQNFQFYTKTNYSEYCLNSKLSDELVIFHGGFYSPAHGVFFRFIADAAEKNDIPVFFWADIDYGGLTQLLVSFRGNKAQSYGRVPLISEPISCEVSSVFFTY